MLFSSSNLALISISADTVFPFSAAVTSAFTIGESIDVLYKVWRIVSTFGSAAACSKNRKTTSKLSYGW